ncbi:MAG: hypothetical protein Q9222_003373 [Ikaeria aurantiellina]
MTMQTISTLSPTPAHLIAQQCGLPVVDHIFYRRTDSVLAFQALGDLGRGSMGDVEKVSYNSHRPFVRKKMSLKRSPEDRKRWLEMIHNEVSVMKSLSHLHIVQVIGTYSVEATSFAILMDPVGEGDLRELLEEMEIHEAEIPSGNQSDCDLYDQRWNRLYKWHVCLASALAYIHSQGIRHEDLKPSNIIHRGSEIYLTDFGSSTRFDFEGTTSTASAARSTRRYQAPELRQVGHAGRHGRGADVYSLGCIFLEMEVVLIAHLRIQQQLPWQIKEFRSFCFSISDQDHPADDVATYGQATDRVSEWLELPSLTSRPSIADDVLKPMLLIDRKARPSAGEVCQKLLTYPSRQKLCACHSN